MPDALRHVAASLEWLGSSIDEKDLPRFEINYTDNKANYVRSYFGAEESLRPKDLPHDLSEFDCIHLVPLGDLRNSTLFFSPAGKTVHDKYLRGPRCISSNNNRMTLPMVVAVGFIMRRSASSGNRLTPLLPLFLVAFAALVAINSFDFLSVELASTTRTVSQWCLLCGISALGIRTSLGELATIGPQPLLTMVLQTLLLAAFVVAALLL